MTTQAIRPTRSTSHQTGMLRRDGSPVRVLIVDDEPSLTELLGIALRHEGCDVRAAATGDEAVRLAASFGPDVVTLDLMLPDMNGQEVLLDLHRDRPSLPVMFVSAEDSPELRAAALAAGAGDYLIKPFSLEDVVTRLADLLERHAASARACSEAVLEVGDLTLDPSREEVLRGGERVTLSQTEFALLQYLMRNQKRVLSKAQILDHVWEYDFNGDASIVESYISYLRRKIDAREDWPAMIQTKRGVGYLLRSADRR